MVAFLQISLVILLTVIIYVYLVRKSNYWKYKGVPFEKGLLFFGNFFHITLRDNNVGKYLEELYNKFETPYFGFMTLNQPYLVLRDPEIIKKIMIKDFDAFPDRVFLSDAKIDPIMAYSLLGIKHPHWQLLRKATSPIFTSGMLKTMLPLIIECAKNLEKFIYTIVDTKIECQEIAAKFTTDVISTCAFGIKANSFVDENSQLRVAGRKLTKASFSRTIQALSYSFAHILVKLFRFKFFEAEAVKFLTEVFKETFKLRQETNMKRNDLIDILINLKNCETNNEFKLEGDKMVAPALMFFLAGHDATSATISFTLHELCVHTDVQNRLRNEILAVVEQHGRVTYEAIQEMTYLHQVVCEILRIHTFTPFLQRKCVADYRIPETGLLIERGTNIIIPQHGLHGDPKYFQNPLKFDPDRFSAANKHKLPSCVYMPFGEGPRNCVGERFGLLTVKIGIIYALSEFIIEKDDDTAQRLTFCRSDLLRTVRGVRVKFRPR